VTSTAAILACGAVGFATFLAMLIVAPKIAAFLRYWFACAIRWWD
jgi:hypothetical protein